MRVRRGRRGLRSIVRRYPGDGVEGSLTHDRGRQTSPRRVSTYSPWSPQPDPPRRVSDGHQKTTHGVSRTWAGGRRAGAAGCRVGAAGCRAGPGAGRRGLVEPPRAGSGLDRLEVALAVHRGPPPDRHCPHLVCPLSGRSPGHGSATPGARPGRAGGRRGPGWSGSPGRSGERDALRGVEQVVGVVEPLDRAQPGQVLAVVRLLPGREVGIDVVLVRRSGQVGSGGGGRVA